MTETRKMTFAAKESCADGRYCVVAEGEGFRFDLLEPATAEHAEELAITLNKNVAQVVRDKWA